MRSDSLEMQLKNSVNDTSNSGDFPAPLTSEEVQVGIEDGMTHAERQEYLMQSELGQRLGIAPKVTTTVNPNS